MALNRRRHANAVPLASIATWVLILAALGVAGLGYVYLKNQIHVAGTKIKTLERELAALVVQDAVVCTKIDKLSARDALQRQLDQGFIKLTQITPDRLMRVDAPARKDSNELRAVSNERLAE